MWFIWSDNIGKMRVCIFNINVHNGKCNNVYVVLWVDNIEIMRICIFYINVKSVKCNNYYFIRIQKFSFYCDYLKISLIMVGEIINLL